MLSKRAFLLASTCLTFAAPAIAQTVDVNLSSTNAGTCLSSASNPSAGSVGLTAQNGQIIGPNGQPVTFRGINVNDTDMASAMANLLQQHPGVNFIRLAVFSYQDPSAYQAFVNWAAQNGITVEFENHQNSTGADIGGGTGDVFTNANGLLQPEQAWYGAMAGAYKGNSNVIFGTDNEPPMSDPAALANWQQTTYQTIRSAGNNNLVLFEAPGGGVPGQITAGLGITAADTNAGVDEHYYPWATGSNANSAAANLTSMVQQAQTIKSANGTVPVMLAEVGQYDGTNVNTLATQAAMNSASSGQTAGVAFWEYNDGDPNNLNPSTAYGRQIDPWIAASGASPLAATPGCTDTPQTAPTASVPAPVATPTPAPPQTVATRTPSAISMPSAFTDPAVISATADSVPGQAMATSLGSLCTPLPGGAATGSFTTQNGQIIAPDGSVFIAKGINLYDADMGAAAQVLATFPGINFIRLAAYTYQPPSYYSGFLSQMSAAHVVVEIEHHIGAGGGVPALTGSDLAAENAWFTSLASAFKGNPYDWLGTINEPSSGGGLGAEQASNIQAIRGTGNANIILISAPVEADVSGQSGLAVDQHFYGWEATGYNTDQSVVTAALTNSINQDQQLTTATGKIPLIIGETGNSTDGQNLDANAAQVLTADQSSGYGVAYWNWASGAAQDNLTDGSGNLTAYGRDVAAYIALIASAPASIWACHSSSQTAATVGQQVVVAQAGPPATATPTSATAKFWLPRMPQTRA